MEKTAVVEVLTATAGMSEMGSWTKFNELPPIPGFVSNFVVMFHDERILLEEHEETMGLGKIPSYVTESEVINLAVEVCTYLKRNGTQSVFVASNFLGQARNVLNKLGLDMELHREAMDSTLENEDRFEVTIAMLFSDDGRVPPSKLAEVVQNSIILSRSGVIVIGNKTLLEPLTDPTWTEFAQFVKANQLGSENIKIYCSRHHLLNCHIFNAVDIRHFAPRGGCNQLCGNLPCGHPCLFACHPDDRDHKTKKYRCHFPCKRKCPSGHTCNKWCWEECRCEVMIWVEYPCNHFEVQLFPCYLQGTQRCGASVRKVLKCGHDVLMQCYEDEKLLVCDEVLTERLPCTHLVQFKCSDSQEPFTCKIPMLKSRPCGHNTWLPCYQLADSPEEEEKCQVMCDVQLKCGHKCQERCHPEEDHEKMKCQSICERKCARGAHDCGQQHLCSEPCEPCTEEYEHRLLCGHSVKYACFEEDLNEDTYFCREVCNTRHRFCRHYCQKPCGAECGLCEVTIYTTLEGCPFGHLTAQKCGTPRSKPCQVMVLAAQAPGCGHHVYIACHERDNLSASQIQDRCTADCGQGMSGTDQCGHTCPGTCRACQQGRFHVRCMEPCGRILICDHICTSPCGMVCPPCFQPCVSYCEHTQCKYECGVPCSWNCEKPCTYQCEHSRCTKQCSEVCNKRVCYRPCKAKLKCGHSCVGYCGEPCPPYCRFCNEEELITGCFSGSDKIDEEDRFIFLEDCGHCIESSAMDSWMKVKTEGDEILPKRCPLCHKRIRWIRRYSKIMEENRHLVDSVRKQIFGDVTEINRIVKKVQKELAKHEDLGTVGKAIYNVAHQPTFRSPNETREFSSMYFGKAKFLKWILLEWLHAAEVIKNLCAETSVSLTLPLFDYWKNLLVGVSERRWPLHPNEIQCFNQEKLRIDDAILVYSRVNHSLPAPVKELVRSRECVRMLARIGEFLWMEQPYTSELRDQVHLELVEFSNMLNCTIQLSDAERKTIVSAFGQRSGRWFKCENGHIYVITECGGATQLSLCHECGAVIGGESHVMAERNYLATEMDGAVEPLYPTALTRVTAQLWQ